VPVEHLALPPSAEDLDGLAALLVDCVRDGASVGFLAPLPTGDARAATGTVTLVAREGGRIVGAVQLVPAAKANARHRAEVAKLLVHPDARRRGIAGALMARVDDEARALGRTLLLLDTETGSRAERCYAGWGWEPVGVVDRYAAAPDGRLVPTTYMAKHLTGG
jgi:GNAT superfamily N-acetyltransferase